MGTFEEQHGFEWIVPPDEPVERVKEDKNRPAERQRYGAESIHHNNTLGKIFRPKRISLRA